MTRAQNEAALGKIGCSLSIFSKPVSTLFDGCNFCVQPSFFLRGNGAMPLDVISFADLKA